MKIKDALVFAIKWIGLRCDDALREEWVPEKDDKPLPLSMYVIVVSAALLISLPGVLFNDVPFRDVALRYAPMADAFASGNFAYAFHPGVPMLHPLLAGCVSFLTGCSGFMATKIVSMLFFAFAPVPLMALMRRVYSTNVAVGVGYLYLIAAPLIRLSFSGLREMEKCFLILLAAYALVQIYQERRRWPGYLWAGIAAGLAVLTRVDMILYAAVVTFFVIRLDVGTKKLPFRSFCTCATALLLSLPAYILNWKTIGAAVPDSRLTHFLPVTWTSVSLGVVLALVSAYAVCMIWVRIPEKVRAWTVVGVFCAGGVILLADIIRLGRSAEPGAVGRYINSIWYGAITYWGIATIVGLVVRLLQWKWKKEETILLLLSILHTGIVLGVILLLEKKLYVSARYLQPVIPLLFGWGVIGAVATLHFLEMLARLVPYGLCLLRIACYALFLGLALMVWYYSFAPVVPYRLSGHKRMEREAILDFSREIREREAERKTPRRSDPPPFHKTEYRVDQPLRIRFLEKNNGKWQKGKEKIQVIAYLANARISAYGEAPDYIVTMRGPDESGIVLKRAHLLSRKEDKRCIYELWSLKR